MFSKETLRPLLLDNENYFNCIVTNILHEQKKEETDKKSVSFASVPAAGIE